MRTSISPTVERPVVESGGRRDRLAIYTATAFTLAMAIVYFLIGLKVVSVIDPSDDQPAFGFAAGAAFSAVAVLLLTIRHRYLWIALALLELFVVFTYFNLADQREPSFETWGILLRVLQVPVVAALGYLIYRGFRRDIEPAG